MNIYNEIENKALDINCISMTLIQCNEECSMVFTGTGFIKQNSEGILSFRLLYDGRQEESIQTKLAFRNSLSAGSIIPEEHFFDLEATDIHGNKWYSEKIYLNVDINVSHNTGVISSDLDSLRLEKPAKEKEDASFSIACLGDYRIPYSVMRPYGNGGSRLCETNIELDGVSVNVVNEDKVLYISVSSCDVSRQKCFETSIIQSLGILLGKRLPVLYVVRDQNGKKETEIKSDIYIRDGTLESPIHIYHPVRKFDFDSFLQSYCKKYIAGEIDSLYGFWYKLFNVSNSVLEASTLSCGVAIEGIIRSYYEDRFPVTSAELEAISEAKSPLKKLEINQEVKSKLQSSLGNFKTKSPKRVMFEICEEIGVADTLVKDWSEMRNKSAHASDVDLNKSEFEVALLRYKRCLYFFYRLMFDIIEYRGKCIDYSADNLPDISVKIA